MEIEITPFGSHGGQEYVEIIVITDKGTRFSFSDLGARINRWSVPTEDGYDEIVLGHINAEEVFESPYYYGATIGPFAGRIANGSFQLDGKDYHLSLNDGPNHLHGGNERYDLKQFQYHIIEEKDQVSIVFTLDDQSKEYPSGVLLEVTHTVTNDNLWEITYKGQTEGRTLFNPTNHVYFNLNGNNRQDITNHLLSIQASKYLPLTAEAIPLGNIEKVDGTPFDLRTARCFGDLIETSDSQFRLMEGFDHPFILDQDCSPNLCLSCPDTGREMTVRTTNPIMVIYTHNRVPVPLSIWGNPLIPYSGIAIEAQEAPDNINQPHLGNSILDKGATYQATTSYQLTIL